MLQSSDKIGYTKHENTLKSFSTALIINYCGSLAALSFLFGNVYLYTLITHFILLHRNLNEPIQLLKEIWY